MPIIVVPTGGKTLTVKASRKGFIRYQCCQCGKTSLYGHTFIAEGSDSYHVLQSEEAKLRAEQNARDRAVRALDKQDDAMFDAINVKGSYGAIETPIVCPHCGKVQPWSDIPPKRSILFSVLLWAALVFLPAILLNALDFHTTLLTALLWILPTLLVTGLFVGRLIRRNRAEKDLQKESFLPPIYYNRQNFEELAAQPPADLFPSAPEPDAPAEPEDPQVPLSPELLEAFKAAEAAEAAAPVTLPTAPSASPAKPKRGILPVVIGVAVYLLILAGAVAVQKPWVPELTTCTYQELRITLPESFETDDSEQDIVYFFNDDVTVYAVKYPFDEGFDDWTVDDFFAMLGDGCTDVQTDAHSDPPCITSQWTNSDNETLRYLECIYRTRDAYWVVSFAAYASDWSSYASDFRAWADTVEFTD